VDIFRLDRQCAFVTGAGSGIGRRIAIALAEAGADVGCFDLTDSNGIETTAAEIGKLERQSIVLRGDVTCAADLAVAIDKTEHEIGPVSVAVNSAGIANAAPAENMEESQWKQMLEVNLTGVFLSCQAEARVMLPRGTGSVVNIASMSGTIVNRGLSQAHYNASKAGVVHLSKSLAMEWRERGVRVNSVSPGYTATPMNLRPEVATQVQRFEADTPLGRMATTEEIAWPVVFLASPAASFCTGLDLVIDGGFTCW